MKRLICEMCESTEFVKDNGMFICQGCGMKYTLEEARKLMVEVEGSPVTASTPVQISAQPTGQTANLLNLAQSSYDSKNYAQAEEFCNQVIALDAQCYQAWKLKGQAINLQITATNKRILEAYNCVMTAYGVLSEAEKAEKKFEILALLKDMMEGEVSFWLDQFVSDRPTMTTLQRTKNSLIDSFKKMANAFEVLGFAQEKEGYLQNFDNFFIQKANSACVSSWKNTVAYNYFRDDLKNLGSNWNRNPDRKEPGTDYYRPNKETFSTFLDETGVLVDMLLYCETRFNSQTGDQLKIDIYENLAYFYKVPIDQCSYKPMVTTWTNGYGAVTSRNEYYEVDTFLTDSAKGSRRIQEAKYTKKANKIKADRTAKQRLAEQEAQKAQNERYWQEHAEERERLVQEKEELLAKIAELDKQIAANNEKNNATILQKRRKSFRKRRPSRSRPRWFSSCRTSGTVWVSLRQKRRKRSMPAWTKWSCRSKEECRRQRPQPEKPMIASSTHRSWNWAMIT